MRIPRAVVPALVLAHAVGVAPCAAHGAGGQEVTASLAVDARSGARGCLSRADLVARIARRSSRIRVVGEGGSAVPALRAAVEAAPSGAVAVSLSFAWPGGARSERRLSARSCAEAADAVALVIVLALDPSAAAAPGAPRLAPPAAPVSSGPGPVGGAPAPSPDTPPPVTPAPGPTAPPPVAGEPVPPSASASASTSGAAPASPLPPASEAEAEAEAERAPDEQEAAPTPIPAMSRFWVGLGGRAVRGPAPRQLLGLGLVVAWELERASVWSPLVQVIGSYYARAASGATGGTATFGLDLVTLQLCPLRVGDGLIGVRLCAAASGGRLVARGSDTFNPRSGSPALITAGGAALLAVTPHPRIELAASVEPAAALISHQFTFDPNIFYAVPRLIWTFGIAVAVKFP